MGPLVTVLKGQLAASRREVEEARLWEGFLNEDHRRAMIFRIRHGAVVALATAQLHSSMTSTI